MAAYLLLSLPLFQLSHALSVQQNSLVTIIPTNSLLGRAPPVLPSGWTYKSCVREPSSGRTLTGYSFTSSSMTVDLCVSACATRGYSLAGAEYANECYCGNSFAGAATGGGSVPPESECNMACAGDASQTCGAGNRLSVYANSQITPGAPALPPGWSSTSKCITEASTGRALTGNSFTSKGLTLDQCVDVCDQTGFQYAGAEYGAECYCSNSVSTANGGGVEVAASECNMNCAGNPQQKCGAGYRITLFSKTPSTDPIPTGWTKNFCTVDQSARVLDGYSFTDGSSMSPATCIAACAQPGVENGNECHCGNTIKQAYPTKDSDCRVSCSGDDAQFCGGGWRLMVYIKAPGTPTGSNAWTLVPGGNSGVVMTHVAVTTSDTMLVIDRKEDNPLLKADGKPAWGAVWNLQSNTARPLNIATHSFCSSGNFLSNGTLANFGGHPYTDRNGEAVSDGQQGIRLFNPCSASGNCDIYENPTSVNNPTYEFFPAKNINGYNGLQIPSQFFKDTLPHNTFPHVLLPNFPNGQRVVYPMNAYMLIWSLAGAYRHSSDELNGEEIDAQHDYASAQCSRMVLDAAGIAAGWKVEYMPEPRNSNADNPTFTPLLYDPSLPAGQRFTHANMPTSNIGRLYHSVATLLPSGAILIGGSNPNDDMETRPWPSEYRVEYLNPRPTYTGLPAVVNYGATFTLSVSVPSSTATVKVVLMDLGFITHSVHMDQKAVELVSTLSADRKTLTVIGPPNAPVYSPGPGWIFVVVGDTPSVAQKLIIGTGASPPKDDAATANMLANTANPISGPHRRRHTRRRRYML
ncbi:copper radical oxidase [Rhizoctonia solani AG-1 IA]|uniref:Copper radical oxidase n=1 Tax=Thanatephorus cucumeris (strain AG1-IA) TaxID=983506 RepID=L8X3A8_THACA|nr:copper radical oxidase [Rhizoctonia solani AG-1 IA]